MASMIHNLISSMRWWEPLLAVVMVAGYFLGWLLFWPLWLVGLVGAAWQLSTLLTVHRIEKGRWPWR